MDTTPHTFSQNTALHDLIKWFPGAEATEVARLINSQHELTNYLALTNDLTRLEVLKIIAEHAAYETTQQTSELRAA